MQGTVVPRDATIPRPRAVLRTAEPVDHLVQDPFGTRIAISSLRPLATPFGQSGCRRANQAVQGSAE